MVEREGADKLPRHDQCDGCRGTHARHKDDGRPKVGCAKEAAQPPHSWDAGRPFEAQGHSPDDEGKPHDERSADVTDEPSPRDRLNLCPKAGVEARLDDETGAAGKAESAEQDSREVAHLPSVFIARVATSRRRSPGKHPEALGRRSARLEEHRASPPGSRAAQRIAGPWS